MKHLKIYPFKDYDTFLEKYNVKYQSSEYCSFTGTSFFYDCENIPDVLPEYADIFTNKDIKEPKVLHYVLHRYRLRKSNYYKKFLDWYNSDLEIYTLVLNYNKFNIFTDIIKKFNNLKYNIELLNDKVVIQIERL